MKKVKAHAKVRKNLYIHNDIDQSAFYFRQRIEERAAKDDRDGIGQEMMACLILLTFSVEAKFNFLGHKLIDGWKEREPFLKKVKAVRKHLGVNSSFKERPYEAIKVLKEFRDTLAHGKPDEVEWEGDITATEKEIQEQGRLRAGYEAFLKEEFVFQAYDDVEAIWKDLIERSGLNIADTITQGGIEYSFIAEAGGKSE